MMETELKPTEVLFTKIGSDISHQIIFSYWKKDFLRNKGQRPLVYCSIFLNRFSFWKRLKVGLKYIFGQPCEFGYFDEFVFTPEDGYKLNEISNYLLNVKVSEYVKKYPELNINQIKKKIKEEYGS